MNVSEVLVDGPLWFLLPPGIHSTPRNFSAMLAANRIRILAAELTRLQSSAPEVIRQINPIGFPKEIPFDPELLSLATKEF